jgi:hypothetical protein
MAELHPVQRTTREITPTAEQEVASATSCRKAWLTKPLGAYVSSGNGYVIDHSAFTAQLKVKVK